MENWSGRELWCPAFRAPAIGSAIGSGDSSIAGFLTAFLRGLSIEQALRTANCLGWQNVQALDAVSGVKSWDETIALLEEGIPSLEANVEDTGRRWQEELGLWSGPGDRSACC